MSCDIPPKAVCPTVPRENLVYSEITSEFSRLGVQCKDEERMQSMLREYLETIRFGCEILLKVSGGEEAAWSYYLGELPSSELLELIGSCHMSVFHDGSTQLLFRDKINKDYLCLDDHDILYFYLNEYNGLLQKLTDFEKVPDESMFIFSQGHWHYRPKDADRLLEDFIVHCRLRAG